MDQDKSPFESGRALMIELRKDAMDYKLYLGDCIEYMKSIPDKSVDAVISDPPYNVGIKYGIANDSLTSSEYRNLVGGCVEEYNRISSGKMVLVLGSKSEILKTWWDFMPHAKLIIVRMGAISNNKINGLSLQYHPILTTINSNVYTGDLWQDIRWPGEGYYFNEPRYGHPAMTPLLLANRLVSYFTQPGSVVFDPYTGSGTIGVASINFGRSFIGCEIEPAYYAIAEKRIKQAQMQMLLPLDKEVD